jgi:hypothetical protein
LIIWRPGTWKSLTDAERDDDEPHYAGPQMLAELGATVRLIRLIYQG